MINKYFPLLYFYGQNFTRIVRVSSPNFYSSLTCEPKTFVIIVETTKVVGRLATTQQKQRLLTGRLYDNLY